MSQSQGNNDYSIIHIRQAKKTKNKLSDLVPILLHGLQLVGGLNPSEKYESQLGWLFPIYGTIKNVPNHQPVLMVYVKFFGAHCTILAHVKVPTRLSNVQPLTLFPFLHGGVLAHFLYITSLAQISWIDCHWSSVQNPSIITLYWLLYRDSPLGLW